MASSRLTRREITSLLDQLETVRRLVTDGDMTASTATLARIEGACTALRVVIGDAEVRSLVDQFDRHTKRLEVD